VGIWRDEHLLCVRCRWYSLSRFHRNKRCLKSAGVSRPKGRSCVPRHQAGPTSQEPRPVPTAAASRTTFWSVTFSLRNGGRGFGRHPLLVLTHHKHADQRLAWRRDRQYPYRRRATRCSDERRPDAASAAVCWTGLEQLFLREPHAICRHPAQISRKTFRHFDIEHAGQFPVTQCGTVS